MTKTTKVQAAKQIVVDNPNATRSEIVHMFIDQLGMSKAGATTYAYNLAKSAAKRVKKVVEKAVKAGNPTISKEIEILTLVPETTILPGIPEVQTAEQEEMYDEAARKLAAKRERDAARKREKRAAEKAALAA